MAFTAKLMTFKKIPNSTIRPTDSTIEYGVNYSIGLKSGCSVIQPTISISSKDPTGFNYMYINEFDRYYFINNWTWENGLWWASCSCDVLASWRDSIRASSQYVIRNQNTYDTYAADGMYPGTMKRGYTSHDFVTDEKCFNSQKFCYVLSVINGSPNAEKIGGITHYVLNPGQLSNFINYMMGDSKYLGNSKGFGITEEIVKCLVNPSQYISDAYLLPYSLDSSIMSDITTIGFGWWSTSLPGKMVTTSGTTYRNSIYSQTYNIPTHPQATRGAYMNGTPFRNVKIQAGPFGDFDLDTTSLVYNGSTITMSVSADFMGNCELTITGSNGAILAHREANVKVPFKISQLTYDRLSHATNTITPQLQSVGSAAAGDYSGAISNAFTGELNMLMPSKYMNVTSSGNVGALHSIIKSWKITTEFVYCTDDAPSKYGKPLNQNVALNTLTGYTKIDTPVLSISATEDEVQQIYDHMRSGFYLS